MSVEERKLPFMAYKNSLGRTGKGINEGVPDEGSRRSSLTIGHHEAGFRV